MSARLERRAALPDNSLTRPAHILTQIDFLMARTIFCAMNPDSHALNWLLDQTFDKISPILICSILCFTDLLAMADSIGCGAPRADWMYDFHGSGWMVRVSLQLSWPLGRAQALLA